jgi:hypothetical protein
MGGTALFPGASDEIRGQIGWISDGWNLDTVPVDYVSLFN